MGVRLSQVPLRLSSPVSPSLCVIFFPASSGSWSLFYPVSISREDKGPGHLHSLAITPPPPPLPTFLVLLIPYRRLKFVGRGARSQRYARMFLPCSGLHSLKNRGPTNHTYISGSKNNRDVVSVTYQRVCRCGS